MRGWQVTAWVLGVCLTSVGTYSYTAQQFQVSLAQNEAGIQVTRERLSVLESRFTDFERRLANIERLLESINRQEQQRRSGIPGGY